MLLSHRPSETRSVANFTPCTAWGLSIVDFLLSELSSAPPASHTQGIRLCTRSNAFLPGPANGAIGLPSSDVTAFSFSSVALNAFQSVKAVFGSTPAFAKASLRYRIARDSVNHGTPHTPLRPTTWLVFQMPGA